ncbi:exosortase A [Parasphingopyxis sp. CP4]|uniref:exosortase A n=1 Tax=Parasphingopyxis sp. CP4 TaxID=2724527 RepID=UPI0015A1E62B|nr:exosortase A [Parasphingopyxis sp. CP4]QLC21418.1 exosortase A [Parasphingopyxis sp. CP4]
MTASSALERPGDTTWSAQWRISLILLGAALFALLVLFRSDVLSMATVWVNSPTFNHCLLIVPIIGWLIWNRRTELAQLTPQASLWGLVPVGLGAASWFVGEAAGVTLARHLGIIVMMQGSVVTILGITVTRGILFPLGYALFLVPFGEEFIPALQMVTADLCMALLGLFGLPAHMEGVFITTPSGFFEVAEACSGVKFLIAMLALGALAANLCFKSWIRRSLFMAICFVVPIIANGIRAFGTIYIADATGIEFAESFDHIVYGWFFFAIVIAMIFAMAWKFFDREIDDPAFDPADLQTARAYSADSPTRRSAFAIGIIAVAAAPVLWLSMASPAQTAMPEQFALPTVNGWSIDTAPMRREWQATYVGADRIVAGRYRNAQGQIVDLAIAYYADPREGFEPVGIGQGGMPLETEWSWVEDSQAPEGGTAYRIMAPGPVSREVFQYVMVGGALTGNSVDAKLATLRARLFGTDRSAQGIVISSEDNDARAAVEAFVADSGGVDHLVDRVIGLAD